jgi:hypothetical protein
VSEGANDGTSDVLAVIDDAGARERARLGFADRSQGDIRAPARSDQIRALDGRAAGQREMASPYGDLNKPGPYLVLMRWNPGWFSAPHSYATDRICMVMSGTWWVNSGADFDPKHAVPVAAGGFVKRTARTYHYDGVPAGVKEPAVIAIFGLGPVDIELADPKLPPWRRVA